MEVILKQDVKNLGNKDEVVTVRPGYGRNFLIPQGHAILATEGNRKVLAESIRQRAHKESQAIAEKLAATKVEIGAKVGESGKIFGSVNAIQLAEAFRKLGIEVERKNISFDEEAIKSLGTYSAHVKIYKDIKVDVSFEVVAE